MHLRKPLLAVLVVFLAGAVHAAGYEVSIVAPAPDETVHDNRGNVAVVVAVAPPLRAASGNRVTLLLDGKPVASAPGGRIALSGVDRGTHTLRAQLTAADGAALATSAPRVFHIWRASRLFPNRER
jgi:hypothetical protein